MPSTWTRRTITTLLMGGALLFATVPGLAAGPAGAATTPGAHPAIGSPLDIPAGPSAGGPASLVDPMAGTGIGGAAPGNVGEFPGASLPLGMVQFSPDTSPDRQVTTGSGYDFADSQISGFSLTHLSGSGCAIDGDVPILPVAGTVPSDPDAAVEPFSHAEEHATAGNYAVHLGPTGAPAIGVHLTATTRTALGAFTYPSTAGGDDLLFKVSDSANGSTASSVRVIGNDALEGSVTSGDFCGIAGQYTLHFVARFSQPFDADGTWQGGRVGSDTTCTGTATVDCGAWVRFAPTAPSGTDTVLAKIGVSYVSVAGAAANLADEDPGWNLASVARAATATWNGLLDRIAVQGGSVTDQRTFYTALYHSLLFPSVFSDDDSRYVGFDHRVHALGPGQVQFSNISEDDIYRSEVPLLAMLLPGPTSQMVQSMLRDADQTPGGFLPRWVIADNDAGQWDGDSADPVIADAYAYGARGFDLDQALAAMVRGATRQSPSPLDGRANLAADESQGWVPGPTFDVTSFPYTDGGSETLEYSTDDFAISRMAQAAGDTAEASAFARRAQHWQNLFDPATGYLAARQTDGSFPAGPAFQPAGPADQAQGVAQVGFEEGNAVQYTWAVPQNLAGLFTLMGGDHQAVAQLNTYFTQLNATRFAPYDWAGNEPGEGVPFEYDYAGAPWQTQAVVRRIMTQLYPLAPANEPGEDDLGSLSSWYVWSALGLYPETPGVADLAMTSPLFARSVISEGNGHTLTIEGRGAPDPYIQSARLAWGSGGSAPWSRPWLPSEALTGGATLSVKLGTSPDPAWGAASTAAPPSFQAGAAPAVAFTAPGGAVGVSTSVPAPVELGVQEALPTGGGTRTVAWHVASGADVTVSPSSGMIRVVGNRSTVPLQVTSAVPGTHAVTLVLTQGGAALPALTLDVVVGS